MTRRRLDPEKNVDMLELIGSRVRVVDHTDPALVGLDGIIIDESMKTFTIREEKDRKMVAKKGATFEIEVVSGGKTVKKVLIGNRLMFRPQDRTKRLERRKRGSKRERRPRTGRKPNRKNYDNG